MSATTPSGSEPGSGAPVGPAGSLADALLPRGVIVHEELDLAARVVLPPGTATGDWFDSVPLDGGRVGLMVGDVVGRGLAAGATMAQLRAGCRLALTSHPDPARALQDVDRYALTVPAARWARTAVAVIDPRRCTVSYTTAGGPAPIVVRGRRGCSALASTRGGPIGAGAPEQREVLTRPLDPGDVFLLYTDGLLGPRRKGAVQDVVSAVADPNGEVAGDGAPQHVTPDAVCRRALTALDDVPDDDVVVLAAGLRRAWQGSMSVALPVRPESTGAAQRALLGWTAHLGLGEVDEIALAQALTEVVGNVIEHARHPDEEDGSSTFVLQAALDGPGDVEVTVTDRGRWAPPEERAQREARTGGLAVATHFVDDLFVDSRSDGTRVVLRHHVERPVPMATGRSPMPGRPSAPVRPPDDGFASRLDNGVLELAGSLDHHRAREVGEVVRLASLGLDRLIVDLSDVSVLSTASVQAIDARTRTGSTAIGLVAPPDTAAGQVLTMMGIAHAHTR